MIVAAISNWGWCKQRHTGILSVVGGPSIDQPVFFGVSNISHLTNPTFDVRKSPRRQIGLDLWSWSDGSRCWVGLLIWLPSLSPVGCCRKRFFVPANPLDGFHFFPFLQTRMPFNHHGWHDTDGIENAVSNPHLLFSTQCGLGCAEEASNAFLVGLLTALAKSNCFCYCRTSCAVSRMIAL
mgnify:CR=1 FL=1